MVRLGSLRKGTFINLPDGRLVQVATRRAFRRALGFEIPSNEVPLVGMLPDNKLEWLSAPIDAEVDRAETPFQPELN